MTKADADGDLQAIGLLQKFPGFLWDAPRRLPNRGAWNEDGTELLVSISTIPTLTFLFPGKGKYMDDLSCESSENCGGKTGQAWFLSPLQGRCSS